MVRCVSTIGGIGKTTVIDTTNRFTTVDREGDYGSNPKVYGNCFGVNDQDFSCSFGQTSAAAPLVAGIAGLLLSVDSNLTRDQVQAILRAAAVKVLHGDTLDSGDISQYGYGRVSGVRALSSVLRGDMNGIPGINVLDMTYLVQYIYQGGPAPFPNIHFGDANCDAAVNTLDLVYLVNYFYHSGPAPVKPCTQFKPGF